MAALARFIVVDPTGLVQEQVRAAMTLIDRVIIQIDVPTAESALDELRMGQVTALITSWNVGEGMRGWELAARVAKINADVKVLIVADYEDMDLDEQMLRDSPFLYFKRPYDVAQFLRVLLAVIDGKDPREAMLPPVSTTANVGTIAPKVITIPKIDIEKARPIIYQFMSDLSAMAVLLLSRDGKVLIEQGTLGYINRDELGNALTGSSMSLLALHEMAMGTSALFQFYDGENYDFYVLSVGYHHMVVVVFDGRRGNRELGAVRSFGRRVVEDLIAIIGAEAMILSLSIEEPIVETPVPQRSRIRQTRTEDVPRIVRAELAELVTDPEPAKPAEPAPILEEIQGELDLDKLLSVTTDGDLDSLFNLDQVAQEVAKLDDRISAGTLDWDKAQELGLLGGE
jgi:DNA-binding NarL/FixJ family response regulator